MEKIIVLGKGFLGKAFEKQGFEVWGKDKFTITRENCSDYFNLNKLNEYDTIINCIGKSNTRWCELEENNPEAMFSNKGVTKLLSYYCKSQGKKFVHISTGCLYDNNQFPQPESTSSIYHCYYVKTKIEGESCCNPRDLILRPRLYFGDFPDKNNLLCKIPKFDKLLTERNSYTSVHVIIEATKALLDANQSGIFNVACDDYATVQKLGELMGIKRPGITEKELHTQEKLFLVNNIMDLSKLKEFYSPKKLEYEVLRCWGELNKSSNNKL